MIRKLILSAVLTAGTVAGLTLTPAPADARPPVQYRHRQFEVLYRRHGHWDRYGTYRDRNDAERAARVLRHRGFDVRVQRA